MTISLAPRAWSPETMSGRQKGFRHFPYVCWSRDMSSTVLVSFVQEKIHSGDILCLCSTCKVSSKMFDYF